MGRLLDLIWSEGWPDPSAGSMFYPSSVTFVNGRLLVADTWNNRVLVFDDVPTSDGELASSVIGQGDFDSAVANRGNGFWQPVAGGLALPRGMTAAPDGTLYIADRENNRVVGYPSPWGDAASVVLGQADLTSNSTFNILSPSDPANPGVPAPSRAYTSSATMRRPEGVAWLDDQLVVTDSGFHRILLFDEPQTSPPVSAARLVGQETFEAVEQNVGGVDAASFADPSGIAAADGAFVVADERNHRVLTFDLSETPGEADAVWGQIDMIGHNPNQSMGSPGLLARPSGVALDGDLLWLADRDNHRVIGYRDDEPVLVLGQEALDRMNENAGETVAGDTLSAPTDVFAGEGVVVIADSGNNRVLIWRGEEHEAGDPADVVIGQPDFESNDPNRGNGAENAAADALRSPEGVFYEDGRLFVADTGNNRVLVFEEPLDATGATAIGAFCQPDLNSNLPNLGAPEPSADGCVAPRDMVLVGDDLWVADTVNNRVVAFDAGASGAAAHTAIGQPDLVSRMAMAPSATTLRSPTSVAYDGQNLLVVDSGNNRVLVYTRPPTTSGAEADDVIGQFTLDRGLPSTTPDILSQPTRLAVEPLPFNSARVYVADSNKGRVAIFEGLPRIDSGIAPN